MVASTIVIRLLNILNVLKSTIQYNTVQYNTIQYNKEIYSVIMVTRNHRKYLTIKFGLMGITWHKYA